MSAPVTACQPPDPPDPHPSPASPSEADCDPDLEATVPDPLSTSTPQEPADGPVSAPQPETVPEDPRPAHGPSGGHTGPRGAHCGEECADGHTHASRCTQRDQITDAQAHAMLAAVGRAARNAQTASRDDYTLAPAATGDDEIQERAVTAMVAWLRSKHDHDARPFNEAGIRADLTGLAKAMVPPVSEAVRAAADAEWNPVCGQLAIAHQEINARLTGERDQARRWAVALENQLAAVRALHFDSLTARGVVRGTYDDPNRPYCIHDSQPWPCDTIRALDGDEDAP